MDILRTSTKTPRESSKCAEMTAYARMRQTETQEKTAKHKTTGRNPENTGRKKKVCVCVSTCYLISDLLNPPNLERERGQNKRTVQGPELKGPRRQTPFILPKKLAPKLTTNNKTHRPDMTANQDSEDDTRGGGAHGPPLSFRESFWGTVAPRVPKHPPATGTAPKKHKADTKLICKTRTLKDVSRRLAGSSIPTRFTATVQTSSQQLSHTRGQNMPTSAMFTTSKQTRMGSEPFPGAAAGRWTGTNPLSHLCLDAR